MPAEAFSALTEIDPRLAGTVLETLAEAGIAAWVRPFGGTRGGYLEVRVPARPLDCLYVDATRRGDALSVLAEQVPDLLGLRSGDGGQLSAGGAAAGPPEDDSRFAGAPGAGDRSAGPVSGGTSGVAPCDAETASQAGSGRAAPDVAADVGTSQAPGGPGGAGVPGAPGAADGATEEPGGTGGTVSGGTVPGGAAPGGAVPGGAVPGGAVPGGAVPGAGSGAGGEDLDIEAAFALIVAGYTREAQNPLDLPPGTPRGPSASGEVGDSGGPLPSGGPTEAGRPTERGGPAATGEGPSENDSVKIEDAGDDGRSGQAPARPASMPGPPAAPGAGPPAAPGAAAPAAPGAGPPAAPGGGAPSAPAAPSSPTTPPNTWFLSASGKLSSGSQRRDPHDDSDLDEHDLRDYHDLHDDQYDHYEPPPAPPTPSPSPPTRWALVSIGLGVLLLVAPSLVALHASDLVHVAGVLMICTGVGILVARMRHEDEDDDPDDGAVV